MTEDHAPRPTDHLVEPMYQALRDEEPPREPARFFGCLGVVLAAVCLAGWALAGSASARDVLDPGTRADLLENGALTDWGERAPRGWRVWQGAGGNVGPASEVGPGADGRGLVLVGDETTGRWSLVSQRVPVRGDDCLLLEFEASLTDARREPGQYDDAYVGVAWFAPGDRQLGTTLRSVFTSEPTADLMSLRAPAVAGEAELRIFLSHTGRLAVGRVSLGRPPPERSFELFSRQMARTYSYLELKGIDWPALAERYRVRAEAAVGPDAFADVLVELLSELGDLHVTVQRPDGRVLPTHLDRRAPNIDVPSVLAALDAPRIFNRIGIVGPTAEGFGYVLVDSMPDEASFAPFLKAALDVLDAPGLLLDLRTCSGGDDRRGFALAAHFVDTPLHYADTVVRAGPAPGDFSPPRPRFLQPLAEPAYRGPIVCLVGPGCVSSGEGLVLAMKALDRALLVGAPSGGASGNPLPIALPNGVTVRASTWIQSLPDGSPFEGTGIAPDVAVVQEGPGDPTFERGLAELRRLVDR